MYYDHKIEKMMNNSLQKNDIVVALDIGTTKICAIAGRLDEYNKIEVLGFGSEASDGINRGVVSNIDKTVRSIMKAVKKAENQAGFKFNKVHVGVAGQHVKSIEHYGQKMRPNYRAEITNDEVEEMIKSVYHLVLPAGDEILHVIPQEYTVDSERGIEDPVGMSGGKLEANFHVVTGETAAIQNIDKCVNRNGLSVEDLTLEPIASAAAVLSEKEKQAGVVLVDIGGGTTDVTIFKNNIIRHTAVIPFGGNIISRDIEEGCGVMADQAEKLKVKFGVALANEIRDNRRISIPGIMGRGRKEVSEKNLARIIEARLLEIFRYVGLEIKKSRFNPDQLIAGIVLTGGGSLLKHIDLCCEAYTGMNTRIGQPITHIAHGSDKELASPKYATSIGLLRNTFDKISLKRELEKLNMLSQPAEPVHVEEPVEYDLFTSAAAANQQTQTVQQEIDPEIEVQKSGIRKALRGVALTTFGSFKKFFEAPEGDEDL